MLNFIVHTKSGNGQGYKALCKIIKYCHTNNIAYKIHTTSQKGHAKSIAAELSLKGDGVIVAVGGDGTFHEVINGAGANREIPVGFIPAGRGNDYARATKLSLDPIRALKDILRGEIIKTDLIDISGITCLNVAGTGLDVDVLKRVEDKSGKITYLLSLLHCIKHFKPYYLTVENEGKTEKYECFMVGICNGNCIGGGIPISPLSKIDDGKMNAVIASLPKNGKIMQALMQFTKGKHIGKEHITHYETEEVRVTSDSPFTVQIDGELYDNVDFKCKILKSALKTFKTR